ncbi:hypothetical protein B0H17DRAFT_1080263 [Mycena rosella]|uniref:Uncharacterized protein n=1 Tax=Mycena rosella TaxID=1033263 RepID=A0AAD7D3J7_MYCRO|nr:hypothetical protein B0H17DRAFT_1080263 [Mycena rosella]
MALFSNLNIVIIILSFYCGAGFAGVIPPTATVTGTFSVVYSPYNESTATSPSQSSINPTSSTSLASSSTSIVPPPMKEADASTNKSEFVSLVDNPLILASLVILIIALTVLAGFIYQVCGTRRRLRKLPPSPDAYAMGPRRSLSVKRVVISPLRIPSPTLRIPSRILRAPPPRDASLPGNPAQSRGPALSRGPSRARSLVSQSSISDLPSSDIHQVQRELRGFSVVGSLPNYNGELAASRSSLGTTKTRPTSAANVWSPDRVLRYGWLQDGRRYGVQWDVEAAG